MICLIRDTELEKILYLTNGFHQINFYNRILQIDVNYPRRFRINEIFVQLFNEEIGYSCYKKYKLPNEITIGSGKYSTIQIVDNNIEEEHIVLVNNKLMQNKFNPMFVNGKYSNEYNYYDILTLCNCRIVITNDFIMINQCKNIHVNLLEYKHSQIKIDPVCIKKTITKKKRTMLQKPTLVIKLRSFESIHTTEKQPIFFILFPVLMMSFASLCIGLIMAYQGYMQGRELIEVLPSLLLPVVMILGGVLVQPLQRRYENKKILKKNEEYHQNINNYFENLQLQVNDYEMKLLDYEKQSFLTSNEIVQDALNDCNYFQNKTKSADSFLMIPLGFGDSNCDIIFENIPHEQDKLYFSSYEIFIKKNELFNNHTIYCNLLNSRNIVVNSKELIVWIIFYLITQIDSKEIELYIVADCMDLEVIFCFLFFEHFTNHIFNTVKEYTVSNKQNNKTKVVINLSNEDNLDDGNVWISLYHNNLIPVYSDVIIQLFDNRGIIQTKNQKQFFSFNENHEDILLKTKEILASLNYKKEINVYNNEIIKSNELQEIDFNEYWKLHDTTDSLIVNIGIDKKGNKYSLDLHENMHGPHMIIAATTGAGKSECIITYLTALAMNYSYQYVQFVIVDFKGGGLANAFQYNGNKCPHLRGVISNLDELEIERFFNSLRIESKRRQMLFKNLSDRKNCSSMDINKYQKLSKNDNNIEKIAHLFVVVDEFAELKNSYDEYSKELISLARIGRSLGIHLILSTQKPSSVVDPQVWSNCRTRICLRVQEKQDSTEMIGCDAAFYLEKPGQFFQYTDSVLSEGLFYYLNKSFDMNQCYVKDFSNHVYKSKINKNGDTISLSIMKKIINTNREDVKPLWQLPLDKVDKKLALEIHYSIGMIDDITLNEQYPCILDFSNLLIVCRSQSEIHKFINTLLYSYNMINESIEVFIIDFDKEFTFCAKDSQYIHTITSDELLENLYKILEMKSIEKNIIIIIPNSSIFIDKLQKLQYDFTRLLSKGLSKGITYWLFSYTTNAVPYSLWGYFRYRIASSTISIQELSVLFEERIKSNVNKDNFYYIKKDRLLLFRKYTVNNEDLLQMPVKQNTKIYLDEMETPLISDDIYKIAKSYENYQWINIEKFPYIVIISRNHYMLNDFCRKMFSNIPIIQSIEDLVHFEYGIIYCNQIDIININEIRNLFKKNTKPIIFCIDVKEWSSNWIKCIFEDRYCLWIGNGFNDQYIIPNNAHIDCKQDEGFYYHKGKGEKVKLVDELRDNN